MKTILFCANPYAFGILKPLHDELIAQKHEVLWFVPDTIIGRFPYTGRVNLTQSVEELFLYSPEAIFVPGNEVPHYLRGVKVQIFHGLAGEKKGHFRIRHYFDLYLTQGPYFTRRFNALKEKYRNFEVVETGWCKLDPLYQSVQTYREERNNLLTRSGAKRLILYAPTFSPSLTSALTGIDRVFELADDASVLLMVKFHDLMDSDVVEEYARRASGYENVTIIEDRNILKYMAMADLMVSDTSSVVYEFQLLNKPVVTINSKAESISWRNIPSTENLADVVFGELENDTFSADRAEVVAAYHPYSDGKSSARMIAAVQDYIENFGVPDSRSLNLYRRYKVRKLFGPKPR